MWITIYKLYRCDILRIHFSDSFVSFVLYHAVGIFHLKGITTSVLYTPQACSFEYNSWVFTRVPAYVPKNLVLYFFMSQQNTHTFKHAVFVLNF